MATIEKQAFTSAEGFHNLELDVINGEGEVITYKIGGLPKSSKMSNSTDELLKWIGEEGATLRVRSIYRKNEKAASAFDSTSQRG